MSIETTHIQRVKCVSLEVSIKKFREAVEKIQDPETAIKVKTGYLLAARNSEILTECCTWDLLHNASKPYGLFMKYGFQDFTLTPNDPQGAMLGIKEPISEKAFVVTMAVAKRGKRLKKKEQTADDTKLVQNSPEEIEKALLLYGQKELLDKVKKGEVQVDPLLIKALLGKINLKSVALPCDPKYEPWTLDLLKWIKEKGRLSFPIQRWCYWEHTREALKDLLPKKSLHSIKNPLRHFRISHLISYYQLEPYEITAYTGWTIAGTFRQMGIAVSSNLDAYAHLQWRQYFPRLLKPIAQMK
jgi:hypothetical protein